MTRTPTYLVSDYMQTHTKTVPVTASIRDAVEMMIKKKTNGLVVVDKDQRVAGIVSSWDVIEYIVPDYLEADKHLAAFESGHTFLKRILAVADEPITACMTKQVHVARPNQSLMTAAALLSEFHIRQLPVVDDDGRLIGYLNRTDIKLAIGDVLKTARKHL